MTNPYGGYNPAQNQPYTGQMYNNGYNPDPYAYPPLYPAQPVQYPPPVPPTNQKPPNTGNNNTSITIINNNRDTQQNPSYNPPTQTAMITPVYTPSSGKSMCHVCHIETSSYVDKHHGTKTYIWCVVLLCFTGICCFIPFLMDDCKETDIKCATCNTKKTTL